MSVHRIATNEEWLETQTSFEQGTCKIIRNFVVLFSRVHFATELAEKFRMKKLVFKS